MVAIKGTNISSVSGIVLLLLYYFAYPPFGGDIFGSAEGNLFIVNKNLIEALALMIIVLLKEKGYGIYALPIFKKNAKGEETTTVEKDWR